MKSASKNWMVMLGVAVSATIFCAAFLNTLGLTDEALGRLLRITARLAFLIFLVAFIARPLHGLFVTDTTRWLRRERRSFGLAFASMHTVHAGVIVLSANLNPDFGLLATRNAFGALVYLLILVMVITSFDGPARAIGAANWRRLHKTGLYVIGIAFLQTIVPRDSAELQDPARIALVMVTTAAILIRVAAYVKKRENTL